MKNLYCFNRNISHRPVVHNSQVKWVFLSKANNSWRPHKGVYEKIVEKRRNYRVKGGAPRIRHGIYFINEVRASTVWFWTRYDFRNKRGRIKLIFSLSNKPVRSSSWLANSSTIEKHFISNKCLSNLIDCTFVYVCLVISMRQYIRLRLLVKVISKRRNSTYI